MKHRWTDELLDEARLRADPLADQAVADFMEELGSEAPHTLFHRLVAELDVDVENRSAAIQRYLVQARELPDFADPALIRRGQEFFGSYLVHQFAMLFLASLPSAYAAAKGAHPLIITGQLTQNVRRRLNETAQFVMDVNSEGAFEPGGVAIARIEHVRLMHAAVRWLIENDPDQQYFVEHADPTVFHDPPIWAADWGRPVCQEDLVGTMLTFTTVVFNGFDRCGVHYSHEDRDAYFHLWRVIATMLGIDRDLIPDDVESAQDLQDLIWQRQHRKNSAGTQLETALLEAADQRSGRIGAWLFPAMSRVVLDPGVPDMIGVPRAGWGARATLRLLESLTSVWSLVKKDDHLVARVVGRIGTNLMDTSLSEGRHGRAVPFSVPTSLVDDTKPADPPESDMQRLTPAVRSFLADARGTNLRERITIWLLRRAARKPVSPQAASVMSFLMGPVLNRLAPPALPEEFTFPRDHRMDLELPNGWYFLVSDLDVIGEMKGDVVEPVQGEIALVTCMMRIWAVDPETGRRKLGAVEVGREIQLLDGTTAATIVLPGDDIATRVQGATNVRAGLDPAQVAFPEQRFDVQAGPLSYEGPVWDVDEGASAVDTLLPMQTSYVDDGRTYGFDLEYGVDADGHRATWFLQGYEGFAPLKDLGVDFEYYSVAQIPTEGTFEYLGRTFVVQGASWFGHQWGGRHGRSGLSVHVPQPKKFGGWCWAFWHLDNGDTITIEAIHRPVSWWRRRLGSQPIETFGKYIESGSGATTPLLGTVRLGGWFRSPRTRGAYPTQWHFELAEAEFVERDSVVRPVPVDGGWSTGFDVASLLDDQLAMFGNLNEFWEGGTRATGTFTRRDGTTEPMSGRGFSEGVGFEKQLHTAWRLFHWLFRER